ncbi:serine/threonine-protein kinase rad53 [Plakobranchus ocellatus]|uniref:Serine/threonine-protein kinase rad53 n=1 Tax=Plakobranchus ocellatus TaxID=259542 RepID=A0AAV3ZQX4_9GAST|nr:serine/threonine-protein kinase rad53 [Plakobranchus ocellatus]
MSCVLCCGCSKRPLKSDDDKACSISSGVRPKRLSVYQIENSEDPELDDHKQRNAHQLRMQMNLTEKLCSETYGLEVDKANDEPYEAQDFFAFEDILGSGATAVVFKAVFKPTGRTLAVKFIPNFKTVKTMVMRELNVLKLLPPTYGYDNKIPRTDRINSPFRFAFHQGVKSPRHVCDAKYLVPEDDD